MVPAGSESPAAVDTTAPAVPSMQAPPATPDTSTSAPADIASPELLWRSAVESLDPAAFQAEKKSLLESFPATADTSAQSSVVKAYWRLATAIVRFKFAEEEATVLGQATEPQAAHERALLDAARAAALARQQQLQLAITTGQYELAERAFGSLADRLPWPADMPLMGRYRTNFDLLFAGRTAPISLLRIHKLLPTTLDTLEGCAAAANTGSVAVRQTAAAYASGQAALRELLLAIGQRREQTDAFADAVLRYNEQIADYALAVVGPTANPATIVSTLIDSRTNPAAPAQSDGVRQASATEPVNPNEAPRVAPSDTAPLAPVVPTPPAEPNLLPATKSVLKEIRVGR